MIFGFLGFLSLLISSNGFLHLPCAIDSPLLLVCPLLIHLFPWKFSSFFDRWKSVSVMAPFCWKQLPWNWFCFDRWILKKLIHLSHVITYKNWQNLMTRLIEDRWISCFEGSKRKHINWVQFLKLRWSVGQVLLLQRLILHWLWVLSQWRIWLISPEWRNWNRWEILYHKGNYLPTFWICTTRSRLWARWSILWYCFQTQNCL